MSEAFYVHPTAVIDHDVIIGEKSKIWHHVHVREHSRIGKECVLGKGVYIDTGVTIGDSVKIQNGVSIYSGIVIENKVYIGPNATFTNDMYPRSISPDWEIIPTYIRKGASIGANATILCGIEIGHYSMIGAGSVVTDDILPHALMMGNPSRLKGFVCECGKLLKSQTRDGMRFACEICGKKYNHIFNDMAKT